MKYFLLSSFYRSIVFSFFCKKNQQPAPERQNYIIAEVNKMTAEQDVRQCFYDYAEFTGEELLSSEIISKIVERIQLNLTAKDLLFGINEILQEHHVDFSNPKLFENFIVACKLFYNVRKRVVMLVTHESFNQLDYDVRKNIIALENSLSYQLECDDLDLTRNVHLWDEPLELKELKILDTFAYASERILDTFGMAKCTTGSEVVIKEFLKIDGETEKQLARVLLSKIGNHAYNVLASNIYYNDDKRLCFENGLVIDVWARLIYPVELTPQIARQYIWHPKEILHSSKKITSEMLPIEIDAFAHDIAPIEVKIYYDYVIYSFKKLQQAAQNVIEKIDQYTKPIDQYQDISNFLALKRENLVDFVEDIQFSMEHMVAENENITMLDRLNDQIENFYTVLFCKILTIPHQNAQFFTDARFLQEAKDFLVQAIAIAKTSIVIHDAEPDSYSDFASENVKDDDIEAQRFSV